MAIKKSDPKCQNSKDSPIPKIDVYTHCYANSKQYHSVFLIPSGCPACFWFTVTFTRVFNLQGQFIKTWFYLFFYYRIIQHYSEFATGIRVDPPWFWSPWKYFFFTCGSNQQVIFTLCEDSRCVLFGRAYPYALILILIIYWYWYFFE